MKQGSTLFLKGVVILIGIAALAICAFFTTAVISDAGRLFLPILLVIYLTVIPFFFALYQALKLLSYIDTNKAFSQLSVKAAAVFEKLLQRAVEMKSENDLTV